MDKNERIDYLKKEFHLEEHPEGGFFTEVYTASDKQDGRSKAGNIFFLLANNQLSHFHEIDCDEIWYYHEGCGMLITVLTDKGIERKLLGMNYEKGESPMVVIPKGYPFAAENLDANGYSFVSCTTIPKFDYSGFKLLTKNELRERYGDIVAEVLYLAFD